MKREFTITVKEPDEWFRTPDGKRMRARGLKITEFVFDFREGFNALQDQLQARLPAPRHLTHAQWIGDGLLYDIVSDRWVLEPHGHEPGPSMTPHATMADRLKNGNLTRDERMALRARMLRHGVDPDAEVPERWRITHERPVDEYGFCYRVNEDKPADDCRVGAYMR